MKGVLTALVVVMGIVTSVALVAQHAIASAATVFALGGLGTGFVSPPASEKITTWLNGQFDTGTTPWRASTTRRSSSRSSATPLSVTAFRAALYLSTMQSPAQ